jgi:hypothetical protein
MGELLTYAGWVALFRDIDIRLAWAVMILTVLTVLYRQKTVLGWVVRILLWGSIVWIWFLAAEFGSPQFVRNWFVTGLCVFPIVLNWLISFTIYMRKQGREARSDKAAAAAAAQQAATEAAAGGEQ